jgi:arylsulfatase A-like enzyme
MTSLSQYFDRYELAPSHNDLSIILDGGTVAREGKVPLSIGRIEAKSDQPTFWFLNTGETHYPYLLPGETAGDLPHISGVHGVFKNLDEFLKNPAELMHDRKQDEFFTPQQFRAFYDKQVTNVEHLDGVVGRLMDRCPDNTYFMVMSDHGELFGEDGYFGHGPICHEKVFEVFYLEGKLP